MSEKPVVTKGLKKALGFGSLFIIAIGLVVSQASVVSILLRCRLRGWFFFYCHIYCLYSYSMLHLYLFRISIDDAKSR
jgi:hypothetical protein